MEVAELRAMFAEIASQLPALKVRVVGAAVNEANGLIKTRVFGGSGDIYGQPLSPYSDSKIKALGGKSWKEIRQEQGRQTSKKDLQFSGQLSRSIFPEFASDGLSATLVIRDLRYPSEYPGGGGASTQEVAGYLEDQERTDIFAASEFELDEMANAVDRAIDQFIDEITDKYR